jgi:hypothetical protein
LQERLRSRGCLRGRRAHHCHGGNTQTRSLGKRLPKLTRLQAIQKRTTSNSKLGPLTKIFTARRPKMAIDRSPKKSCSPAFWVRPSGLTPASRPGLLSLASVNRQTAKLRRRLPDCPLALALAKRCGGIGRHSSISSLTISILRQAYLRRSRRGFLSICHRMP